MIEREGYVIIIWRWDDMHKIKVKREEEKYKNHKGINEKKNRMRKMYRKD